jgi:UDP-2-acetamido-2,6-beta-L-arabino-hexul-4-ose reductase
MTDAAGTPLTVLVTGARGFVGRNLCPFLRGHAGVSILEHDLQSPDGALERGLREAHIIYHLAGVNRPQDPGEFRAVNAGLTNAVCETLARFGRKPVFVLASSVQAQLDNPYGASKREAEETVRRFCEDSGAAGVVYRLKNLFGKWCRPNYNSVTATFCHNIARGLQIHVSDPANEVDLTYVDDVVEALVAELPSPGNVRTGYRVADELPSRKITLGQLVALIESFRDHRTTLRLPDLSDRFTRALHATYLSYLPAENLGYDLAVRTDGRGSLAEFLKSPGMGQIFLSRSHPGVIRGNHYHHTKVEKFLVVQGQAVVRLRRIDGDEVTAIPVRGEDYRVVDIPPGYAHSIENVGDGELVTLFWTSEAFDPGRPDTIQLEVDGKEGTST